jgi:hypothetical protein
MATSKNMKGKQITGLELHIYNSGRKFRMCDHNTVTLCYTLMATIHHFCTSVAIQGTQSSQYKRQGRGAENGRVHLRGSFCNLLFESKEFPFIFHCIKYNKQEIIIKSPLANTKKKSNIKNYVLHKNMMCKGPM